MTRPTLLTVHDNIEDLGNLKLALDRYTADYDIAVAGSTNEALALLAGSGELVAVLAGGHHAEDLLLRVPAVSRRAHRVLILPWGARSTTRPALAGVTAGRFDRYVFAPAGSADERFHLAIAEILYDHQRRHHREPVVVTLVGRPAQPRSYELRDLLQRSGLPFAYVSADTETGASVLARAGRRDGPFPVLVRFDGETAADPSDEEAAALLGARHSDESDAFDVVVVGAGPAGLSATVSAASEGLRTIMVDAETIGGQAGTSSLIRNYVGFPLGLSGADLCNRALDQAWSFGAQTSVLRRATGLSSRGEFRVLTFADGSEIVSHSVVLTPGAAYRRLGVPALEALVGAGVYYGGGVTEAAGLEGQQVFVVGGGNSAGQASVHLARHAASVRLVVRGASLERSMSDYLVQQIRATANIAVRTRTAVTGGTGEGRLEQLELTSLDSGELHILPAAALFVLIGATPNTGWLPPELARDERGFVLTDRDLDPPRWPARSALAAGPGSAGIAARTPLLGETSMPGVFAAGDARHGSVKRVAAAVGEGGMCIRSVHQYLAALRSAT